MLLKSNSRSEPSSEAASASRARANRYLRRRCVSTRSSQSTFIEPGDAGGRVAAVVGATVSTALTLMTLLQEIAALRSCDDPCARLCSLTSNASHPTQGGYPQRA